MRNSMKKITAISSITTFALVLSLTTITSSQSKKSIKKNGFSLSKIQIGLNKALAAPQVVTPEDFQPIYESAKREVNDEVEIIVDTINGLLTAAGISSCSQIPEVAVKAFYPSEKGDLYSSAVGSKTFPIASVTGVVFMLTVIVVQWKLGPLVVK